MGRRGPGRLRRVPQRLRRRRIAPDVPPGVLRRDLPHEVGRRTRELRRRLHVLPVPLGAGRRQRRRHVRARPAVRRRRRRPADQAHLREPGRRHGRRAGGDRRVQRADGGGLRSAEELFQDWAVAVYLDDEASDRFDIKAVDFGDPASTSWTIDIADDQFWGGRGSNQGAQPDAKWERRANGADAGRAAVRAAGRAVPQPRADGDRRPRRRGQHAGGAALRRHALVRGLREPVRQRARRRCHG